MIRTNPNGDKPGIHSSAYIDTTAVVIGAVTIGKNVYVGPGAVIRADEENSAINIGDNCNVQDRAIIHALANTEVVIEEETSLGHGCIVHGPCVIGKKCFIGFGSVVFKAVLEDGVFVKHLAVIEEARILKGSVIPSKWVSSNQNCCSPVDNLPAFAQKVVDINIELARGYKESGESGKKDGVRISGNDNCN